MLAKCVRCGYSLKGLPGNHACPECGLRFDEKSRIWKRRPRKREFFGLFGYFGGTFGLMQAYRSFGGFSPPLKAAVVLAVLLYVGSFLWLCRVAWRALREGQFVATLPDGVYSSFPPKKPKFIPWKNISRVAGSSSMHSAVLFLKKEKMVWQVPFVFLGKKEIAQFVFAVEDRLDAADAEREDVPQ